LSGRSSHKGCCALPMDGRPRGRKAVTCRRRWGQRMPRPRLNAICGSAATAPTNAPGDDRDPAVFAADDRPCDEIQPDHEPAGTYRYGAGAPAAKDQDAAGHGRSNSERYQDPKRFDKGRLIPGGDGKHQPAKHQAEKDGDRCDYFADADRRAAGRTAPAPTRRRRRARQVTIPAAGRKPIRNSLRPSRLR